MDVERMLAMDADNVQRFIGCAEQLGLKPILPVPLADFAAAENRREWVESRHLIVFGLRSPEPTAPTIDILVAPAIRVMSSSFIGRRCPFWTSFRQLDEIRCFNLMARAAPGAHRHGER